MLNLIAVNEADKNRGSCGIDILMGGHRQYQSEEIMEIIPATIQ